MLRGQGVRVTKTLRNYLVLKELGVYLERDGFHNLYLLSSVWAGRTVPQQDLRHLRAQRRVPLGARAALSSELCLSYSLRIV